MSFIISSVPENTQSNFEESQLNSKNWIELQKKIESMFSIAASHKHDAVVRKFFLKKIIN